MDIMERPETMARTPVPPPPARSNNGELLRQRRQVAGETHFQQLLDAMPHVVMVVNDHREVVCANRALCDLLGVEGLDGIRLSRPGELLGCSHRHDGPDGCGTSAFCRLCGAADAIDQCLRHSHRVLRECRIVADAWHGAQAMDLEVVATPAQIGPEHFVLVSLTDVSDQKRRRALERIFFHDVINAASNLSCLLEIARGAPPETAGDLLGDSQMAAAQLLDEIMAQRQLLQAENDELMVRPEVVDGFLFLLQTVRHVERLPLASDCTIDVSPDSASVEFVSDPTLLRRVLLNLLRNALEASHPGQTITVGVRERDNMVEFTVHNAETIDHDVQMQIFQRHFSTKGASRGLGTYSIKLLTERYLRGQVTFVSTAAAGTTFFLRYPFDLAAAAPRPERT